MQMLFRNLVKESDQIALLIHFQVSFAWVLWEVCILLATEL